MQRFEGRLILRPCERNYRQRIKFLKFDRHKLPKDFDGKPIW